MESSLVNGLAFVCFFFHHLLLCECNRGLTEDISIGVLDRDGNPRKVVNCSCVVVKDYGEESHERDVLLQYLQTEQ